MDDGWLEVASAYAGTSAGREHLVREQREASLAGQDAAAARLRAALLRGDFREETARAEREEARRRGLAPRPRSLQPLEAAAVAERFGVAHTQVLRDHAISHVLAALAAVDGAASRDGDLVFIGGTALARTVLPTLRLSEDVDLLTHAPRRVVAAAIEQVLRRRLRRTLGDVRWAGPGLSEVADTEVAVALLGDVQVRFQLLPGDAYPPWPRQVRSLHQRYSDAPPASLCTLSTPAFVASKLSAWHDRRAPRDLYDLWALGVSGCFDARAAALFARHGPIGHSAPDFTPPPDESTWEAALAHQGRIRTSAADAAREVRVMWRQVVDHA
ncbi:nucleotidyl transferase AbiEii/AbiGii toxin family protein [Kineococcus sp. T13]|nr:nucleotidyl transferase AbiEii/AbiGii toxin family protein [Kineococcus vitellinus]NAZ75375.1 nucleotidyl transferase AbiEii/AbiGii toxin family protein [Kineococcus vitellinus]